MELVERLRFYAKQMGHGYALSHSKAPMLIGAADEIERLREKVEILEAEIRVMRQLPAAVNEAVDKMLAADGQSGRE